MTDSFTVSVPPITTPYWQIQIVSTIMIASSNGVVNDNLYRTFRSINNTLLLTATNEKYSACGDTTKELFYQVIDTFDVSVLNSGSDYVINTNCTNASLNYGIR